MVAWWCAITSVGVVKVEGEVLVVVGEERFAAVLVGGVGVEGLEWALSLVESLLIPLLLPWSSHFRVG